MTQEAFRTMTVFDETPAAADEDLQRLKSALELVGGGTGRVTVLLCVSHGVCREALACRRAAYCPRGD